MALLPVLRAVHIGASVLIAGAFAFDLLILRRAGPPRLDVWVAQATNRWLRLLCVVGVAVGLLSWAGWLALLAINMSGLPPAEALRLDVLGTVVTRTTFGHVWSIRLALFLVLGIYLARPGGMRAEASASVKLLAAAIAVALVCSLAWTGHALGSHPAHLLVDAVHLLAAALWLGMLPPLWLVVRRAGSGREPAWLDFAGIAARRFSAPGVVAVGALVVTGVMDARWLVESAADLVTTRYGLLLLGKVALFVVMVSLAAANRVALTPRLSERHADAHDRSAALRRLRRNVLAEVLLGAAVVGLVGILGVTAPTAHEHAMHQMQDM